MSVESLQRGLALDGGYFIRGGIAIGDLYIDDAIVYGKGLLDAHCKEGDAVFPRVVLHECAGVLAKADYRSSSYHPPLGGRILRDEDGELFVSYLASAWENEDGPPELEWLARHSELVNKELERFQGRPALFAKYAWVAHTTTTFAT